jgi:uroporphyrinogen III methyltransferase/synthase
VSYITGHEDPTTAESAHDWEALAKSASTLVFFMGVKNLPEIAGNLMAAGRPGTTPAALVRWGTTCRHHSLAADLATIADKARAAGFAAPALLVVGEVVRLRERLGWFEKKPLLGRGVVVTRSREQASDLVRLLSDQGACCYEFPSIAIAPLADDAPVRRACRGLSAYDWVIFTSANGVDHFFAALAAEGLDARAFGLARVAAIGPATAAALAGRGIRADFVPGRFVAESVVEGLVDLGVAGKRVLIPRAAKAREVLPERLAQAGAEVTVLPVYETRAADQDPGEILDAMRAGEIRYVTFTSSSTVDNFFARIAPETFRECTPAVACAVIGPITAATLARYGFTPEVAAEEYTIPALARAIADHAAGEKGDRP